MARRRNGFQPATPYPDEDEPEIEIDAPSIERQDVYELPQTDLRIDANSVTITRLVLTPELVAVAIYEARGMLSIAARKLGTTARTVKGFVDREELCRVAYEEADEMLLDFVEAKLYQKIKAGDIASIIFYLRTKGKRRGYTEKLKDNDESDPANKRAQLQESEDKQRELEMRLQDISGRLVWTMPGDEDEPQPASQIDLEPDEYTSTDE